MYDKELWNYWAGYVASVADWQVFLTLTWANVVERERVIFNWRQLVQVLNRDLYGNHYVRTVGHSYFSYVYALEAQRRGALHLHALVDQRLNFNLVHSWWNAVAGFAWARPIEDAEARNRTVFYVTKYVTKGGDIQVYKAGPWKEPKFRPLWLA